MARLSPGSFISEPYEIDVFARAVLGCLEKVDHSSEPRFPGKLWRDVTEFYLGDLLDHNIAIFQPVSLAHCDVRSLPDANARRYLAAFDGLPEPSRELHCRHTCRGTQPLRQPREALAFSSHFGTFTPFTVSHRATDSSPMNAGSRIAG